MWDFSFAIPSLLILGILLFNYFMLQRLPIKINKSFVILLFTETVVITSDIVGSWACDEYASLPRFFVFSTNMVYFIAFAFRGFIFFRFTCETLGLDPSENKFRTFLCQLPLIFCEIIVLSTPWTNAIFYVGTTGYKRGYLYHSITYTFIFYVGLGLFAVLNYKQNLKRLRQKYGVIIYHLMLVLGLIFRQLMPQFLLMDTFCIMGILTINLCFMNPDFYIERRTRLFNTAGLQEFLDEKSTQKYTQIFGFVINHYLEDVEIYSTKQMDAGINLIGASANVILNVVFIPIIGINGAALASLITQFFTNVIVGYIIKPITPNNEIMLKGLNIRYVFDAIKILRCRNSK